MTNEKTSIIEKQQKIFNTYLKLPKIINVIFAIIFLIWAIVDAAVIKSRSNVPTSGFYYGYVYGIFGFSSQLLCFLFWILIGSAITSITYFITKLSASYKILQIEYLKELSSCVKNQDEVDNKTP